MNQKTCAIVTGASSGIGLAIAQKLKTDGHNVINWDIRPPQTAEAGTFGGMFMQQGFMHYVRKNGKQYHPYCAKQVK